ncbi:MAG: hypothetical protein ACPGXK_12730, partial [Phycisphaerae bacterium]
MTSREDRVDQLFEKVLALPSDRREAFLKETCGDDDSLAALVWEMINAENAVPDDFLAGQETADGTLRENVARSRELPHAIGGYQILRE